MAENPMISTFIFDDGITKNIEDCDRDELLVVIRYLGRELAQMRYAAKRTEEMNKLFAASRARINELRGVKL